MLGYVVRRLLQGLATLFLLSILFFLLLHVQGGGPLQAGACGTVGCTETLHLDEPFANQYVDWIGQLARGNFGVSSTGQPIGDVILQHLPPTVVLVLVSLILQQLIALPLGMLAALRPYSKADQLLTFGSYLALSVPAFLIGFVLIYLFGVRWRMLPVGHYEDVAVPLLWTGDWFAALRQDPGYVLGDLVHHLILPALTLTVGGIAIDSRFMRASMLQVLHQDYIRTARAKGLPRRRVIFKHAFRNALLPIITNLGLYLPALIGGVVVVESVFTWGGLGYIYSTSISGTGFSQPPDFTIVQTMTMLSALAVVIANLLADLAYAWLDPRIRYTSSEP